MQKGQLFKRHGAWHLRYRRADGQRVCTRLAPYNDSFRTQKSVRPLAEAILTPINEGREVGPQTLKHFIEQTYLPAIKSDLRPSTVKGYTNLHNRYLAPRIGDVKLWEFRTVDAQRLLNAIAASTELSNRTFFNIKTFLSSVFTDAKRLGVLDNINPVHGVKVPKGQPTEATYAYSLDEVKKITGLLEGAAQTAVIVAAWTGLSMAE